MQVTEILAAQAEKYQEKTAFIFKDQHISFMQLRDAVFKLANSLIELGLQKSDKVAVYLPNCLEYIYSYLAIWCCGATAVPLDFMLTEDELISCISHSEASFLIAKPKPNLSLASLKE